MSEVAAKAAASAGERQRRFARLLQYALLQALILAGCIFVLRLLPPAGPADYAVTEFNLQEEGTSRPVTLPHFTASRHSMDDPPLYSGSFAWGRQEAQHAWSVYLPRFSNGIEVSINGVAILDSRRDAMANRPDRNTPQIAVIPGSLLREGANLKGFLDRIYVGPDDVLRPAYDQRALLFVTLPVVFSAWQAILAVVLAIMWVMRRHEPAYGVLAAAMLLGTVQAFLTAPIGVTQFSRLNAILIASAPLESACVLTFGILFSSA